MTSSGNSNSNTNTPSHLSSTLRHQHSPNSSPPSHSHENSYDESLPAQQMDEDEDMMSVHRSAAQTDDDDDHGDAHDSDSDQDGDVSLQRLSEQAARRSRMLRDHNNEEDDEEDLDFGNLGPAGLIRRIIANGRFDDDEDDHDYHHGPHDDDEEENEEEEEEEDEDEDDDEFGEDDPRAEILRQMAFLTGGRPPPPPSQRGTSADQDSNTNGQSFVDVMQRLMGNGIVFGGPGVGGGGFSAPGSSEYEHLIENLNQREDSYLVLETLNELSGKLLMMNGITAERMIPANKLARSLVAIMKDEMLADHLELQLVACRCLYNFLEVNQDFIHDALNNDAVEVLCGKLMEISYIDLTEQSLQTLEMISKDTIAHNQIIVNNGLKAVLQYLDFLTIHAQRKCLCIVANCCTNVSSNNFAIIKNDVFDSLSGVVGTHNDPAVIENAWLAISRIIMSFKLKPDLLEELFINREPLLYELVHVIYISSNKSSSQSPSESQTDISISPSNMDLNKTPLSYGSCLSLIKSLITLASTSVDISRVLIEKCNVGEVIVQSLSKYANARKNSTPFESPAEKIPIEALMGAPNELLSQFLNLVGYLLPISYKPTETPFLKDDHEDFDVRASLNKARCHLYRSVIADSYWKFVNDIWPLLINSFQATMDYELRRKVIIGLTRIVSFCNGQEDFNRIDGVELITGILASVANNSKSIILKDFQRAGQRLDNNDVDMLSEDEEEDEDDIDNDYEDDNRNIPDDDDEEEEGEEDEGDDEEEDEDEGEEDEGEDEQAGAYNPARKTADKTKPEDMSKLHTHTLLLGTFLISRNLIAKSPASFVHDFEREGLISDTLAILNALKLQYSNTDSAQPNETTTATPRPYLAFASAYTNKYVDTEFTKDYESKMTSDQLYSDLVSVANNIENLHINSKNETKEAHIDSSKEYMRVLNGIKDTLSDLKSVKCYSLEDWKDLWGKLRSALKNDDLNHQISSFELMSSGIIESLSHAFTSENTDFGFDFHDCYKAFIYTFFTNDAKDDDSSEIVFFIQKLQEALKRSESFEIISSGGGSNTYTSGMSRLNDHDHHTAIMARQVKIKLTAEGDTDSNKLPLPMQNMVLSVHAIATFKSIDSFLKQRYRFLEEMAGLSRGRLSRLNANSEEDEEEEAINDHGEDNSDHDELIEEDDDNEDDVIDKSAELKDEKRDSSPTTPKSLSTEFLINGEVIPSETTVYGAIYKSLQNEPDAIVDASKVWSTTHVVTYRKVSATVEEAKNKPISFSIQDNGNEVERYDPTTIHTLKLLKILFDMNTFVKNHPNSYLRSIRDDYFMNWKLTVKLNRQLEDPLVVASGTLPDWSIYITKQFPFIFPLDTRIFFMQSTSFGFSRSIHHWQIRTNQEYGDNQQSSNFNSQRPQLGRPTRQKVRLSRKSILQSAVKVLQLYGSTPGVLEIEYFDEVGSGLGPTLEFYATVSREFSKKKLRLWRSPQEDDTSEYVQSATGLFPSPLDKQQIFSENGRKVLYFFATLGKFVARALLDSRIIDFNFNTSFLRLVQFFNQHPGTKPTSRDLKKLASLGVLKTVDPVLGNSLEHLSKYVNAYQHVPESERANIKIDDCKLEDLALTFTLPGYADYELIPNGDEVYICHSNVELYITKVLEATLYNGIIHQTKAFMEGFSKVFPANSLIIFSPQELVGLLGSADEDWSLATLITAVHANHGYNKESDAIKSLINILVNFNTIEKRSFLQFLTGSPKLPIGGFKALRPELTVVRKQAEDGLVDDDYLPSVMTCANYLKLPNYSSEDVMRRKLLQAANEGAGAFLLS